LDGAPRRWEFDLGFTPERLVSHRGMDLLIPAFEINAHSPKP
jgi:hypothetical protein